MNDKNILVQQYYKENKLIQSDIISFNNFIENVMGEVIKQIGDIVPTVIPPEMEDFRIRLDKIWVDKPQVIEADGSKRDIFPMEARLRGMTYSAPINLEVSAHIDGVQRESFTTQIGKMPVMLKSKFCHLNGLSEKELLKKGEDTEDLGGYFILNGNERILITVAIIMIIRPYKIDE